MWFRQAVPDENGQQLAVTEYGFLPLVVVWGNDATASSTQTKTSTIVFLCKARILFLLFV